MMDIKEFFDIYFNHLEKKQDEVMRIVALGANLEKWFQGEMALAFSNSKKDSELNDNYKILSSEFYNKESDKLSDGNWVRIIGEQGIVSIEGNIYKSVKTGKKEASGTRKVDFLLENQTEIIFSELKIIWISYLSKDPYWYLEEKNLLEDAWRLRTNLYNEIKSCKKSLSLFLTLICIDDCNFNYPSQTKRYIISSLNEYFEDTIFEDEEDKILIKKIPYDLRSSNSIFLEPYEDNGYNGYLVLVNIPLKN